MGKYYVSPFYQLENISNLKTFLLAADCNMLFLLFIAKQYLVFESFVATGILKFKDKTAPGEEKDFKYSARSTQIPERLCVHKKTKQKQGHLREAVWSHLEITCVGTNLE